jgi:hypothetical protein
LELPDRNPPPGSSNTLRLYSFNTYHTESAASAHYKPRYGLCRIAAFSLSFSVYGSASRLRLLLARYRVNVHSGVSGLCGEMIHQNTANLNARGYDISNARLGWRLIHHLTFVPPSAAPSGVHRAPARAHYLLRAQGTLRPSHLPASSGSRVQPGLPHATSTRHTPFNRQNPPLYSPAAINAFPHTPQTPTCDDFFTSLHSSATVLQDQVHLVIHCNHCTA